MDLLLLLAGLLILITGAELLVKGASSLALSMGITPLVVGLTVVAFGTSSPELAVSIQAAWNGQNDLAVANVVGSNIFNILVILGLSALIAPLTVKTQIIHRDIPVMLVVTILCWILCANGLVGRIESIILVALLIAYTAWLIIESKRETHPQELTPKPDDKPVNLPLSLVLILVGLGMLLLGSDWLVNSSINIARALGVSEFVIGVTLVAAGTSMPELATSVLASIRGQREIAIGNVVGSNIFNILGVLGAAGVVSANGLAVPSIALHQDIPIMFVTAILCWPLCHTGFILNRKEGGLLVAGYIAYVAFLCWGQFF